MHEQAKSQLKLLRVSDEAQVELRRQMARMPADLSLGLRCEAVAASMIVAEPSPQGLLVSGPPASRVAAIYLVAALIAFETGSSEGQALLSEANFIMGRESMMTAALKSEGAKRSANAMKGAPKKRFADDELHRLRQEWIQTRGHERGWIKEAAWRLEVTEKTISTRWKEIIRSS